MMTAGIHPTAIISQNAELAEGVTVGPYAVIEDQVTIGAGTFVGPGAVIHSHVRIGRENQIHAHAVIGDLPQDLTFNGEQTSVEIGDGNVIREGVTIHRSTEMDRPTRIGNGCYLMAYSHAAHGVRVGDGVILTNNVLLAGHVEVGEKAVLGANAGVHQFTRVGAFSMVAAYVAIRKDVLPFSLIGGQPLRHYRLNTVGLRRNGITGQRYRALEMALRCLRGGSRDLGSVPRTPEVRLLEEWLGAKSRRGIYGFVGEADEAQRDWRQS